uniref:Uncharacterized protein n=1 Tax=Arundo donax TaxID=35708 RepID=A0A0A9G752_ARUDO
MRVSDLAKIVDTPITTCIKNSCWCPTYRNKSLVGLRVSGLHLYSVSLCYSTSIDCKVVDGFILCSH